MKTIKIFLASSEELADDRNAFGNLVRRLDKIYEKRNIRIKLFEWEDYDAAYNDCRKQDEYNEFIKSSDMFLALFHTVAGRFTIEEFEVATEEFRKHASPKIYTYCKDLQPNQRESPELTAFKKRLFEEMGHYWCRYSNSDSLQLHFVMQLQLIDNTQYDPLTIKDGEITFEGISIAKMDKLRFAANNEEYRRMSRILTTLPDKIAKARSIAESYPDNEYLQQELQDKQNTYNLLKEQFSQYQQQLFETAQRIVRLQGQQVTERMRRAMEAFNGGQVHEANIILDEAERDADNLMEAFRQSQILTERKRLSIFSSIEELQLKASTMLADTSIPIEERIKRVEYIYMKADAYASEAEYSKDKYDKLLSDYASFLNRYAHYNKALEIYYRLLNFRKDLYGLKHSITATTYNDLGLIYGRQSNYKNALECYIKALEIQKEILGQEHPDVATTYNNIGSVYDRQSSYSQALEYYLKSLEISEKTLGTEHPSTAVLYNNIGGLYDCKGDYTQALEYYNKNLNIYKNVYGLNHPSTAILYNNIGLVYSHQGLFSKALEYYFKALETKKKIYGKEHPSTATSYNNIGYAYDRQGNHNEALKYYMKALLIRKKILNANHSSIALTYNHIGYVYSRQGDYDKAIEYYFQALIIYESNNMTNLNVAVSYDNIGSIYLYKGTYDKALDYYFKALDIRVKILGNKHLDMSSSYYNIQSVYFLQGIYDKALEYCFKALAILEENYKSNHSTMARIYCNIGYIYACQASYDKSLDYYNKALDLRGKSLGPQHPHTIFIKQKIEEIKSKTNLV